MLKNNIWTLIGVIILLIVSGTFLYGTNLKTFLKTGVNNPPATTVIPTITPGTEEFTVTGSSFKFDPNEIKVSKGNKIKILFKDSDGPHNFTIPDLHIATKTLSAGQQETVEFIATNSGSFNFFCSYGHHKEFGMTGKIVVK